MEVSLKDAISDPLNGPLAEPPAEMRVTYEDGAGVMFHNAAGKPMLPGLLYDVETAVTIFNTLRHLWNKRGARTL